MGDYYMTVKGWNPFIVGGEGSIHPETNII